MSAVRYDGFRVASDPFEAVTVDLTVRVGTNQLTVPLTEAELLAVVADATRALDTVRRHHEARVEWVVRELETNSVDPEGIMARVHERLTAGRN